MFGLLVLTQAYSAVAVKPAATGRLLKAGIAVLIAGALLLLLGAVGAFYFWNNNEKHVRLIFNCFSCLHRREAFIRDYTKIIRGERIFILLLAVFGELWGVHKGAICHMHKTTVLSPDQVLLMCSSVLHIRSSLMILRLKLGYKMHKLYQVKTVVVGCSVQPGGVQIKHE